MIIGPQRLLMGSKPPAAAPAVPFAYVRSVETRRDGTINGSVSTPAFLLEAGQNVVISLRYEVGTTTTTIGDSAGNVYIPLPAISNSVAGEMWYCLNAKGHASNVVTIYQQFSRSYGVLNAMVFSGNAVYDTNAAAGGTTTATTPAFTTTGSGIIVANGLSYNGGISGFSAGYSNAPFTSTWQRTGYKVTTGAVSGQTVSVSGNTSPSAIQIVAFKAAP